MKKGLSVVTVLFFLIMLTGTFFSRQIDALFRPKVVVSGTGTIEVPYEFEAEQDGERFTATSTQKEDCIPLSAKRPEGIFLVYERTDEFGSYYFVQKAEVKLGEVIGDCIVLEKGISRGDRLVVDSDRVLEDGMRVVLE